MIREVVLKELNKICNRKFKLKIVLKFRNNSMCSIGMSLSDKKRDKWESGVKNSPNLCDVIFGRLSSMSLEI